MNLCIPVIRDEGLDSPVSAHFGSAPCFQILDTDSGTCQAVTNANAHHAHGMCQPLAALAGQRFEGVVVAGIGAGALSKLQVAGVKVYHARVRTIQEALTAWREGTLTEMTPAMSCGGHGHGHEHGHGHGQGGCGHGSHGAGLGSASHPRRGGGA